MRETVAAPPAPKIKATKLKSKRPTNSQTIEPIITSANDITVIIFIFFPPPILWTEKNFLYKKSTYKSAFSKTNLSKSMLSTKSLEVKRTLLYFA